MLYSRCGCGRCHAPQRAAGRARRWPFAAGRARKRALQLREAQLEAKLRILSAGHVSLRLGRVSAPLLRVARLLHSRQLSSLRGAARVSGAVQRPCAHLPRTSASARCEAAAVCASAAATAARLDSSAAASALRIPPSARSAAAASARASVAAASSLRSAAASASRAAQRSASLPRSRATATPRSAAPASRARSSAASARADSSSARSEPASEAAGGSGGAGAAAAEAGGAAQLLRGAAHAFSLPPSGADGCAAAATFTSRARSAGRKGCARPAGMKDMVSQRAAQLPTSAAHAQGRGCRAPRLAGKLGDARAGAGGATG